MIGRSWVGLAATLLWGCGNSTPPDDEPFVEAASHCDAPIAHEGDDALTLFDIQLKSTHNSYHVEPDGNDLTNWAYTLAPLDVQLDEQGVRHFELDVHYDDELGVFEVFHVPLLDNVSTCPTLRDCLATIKSWSETHPGHHAIFVHVEPKDPVPPDAAARVASLHREILGTWSSSCLVHPSAVREEGWPALGASRGKLVLTMLDTGVWRDAYERIDPTERLLFIEGEHITRADHPIEDADKLADALAAGMIVRTRADTDSAEAFAEDTTRRDAALASGAQIISTDWPAPVDEHNYFVEIPGGTPSRCNPVMAPAGCESTAIEDPQRLR